MKRRTRILAVLLTTVLCLTALIQNDVFGVAALFEVAPETTQLTHMTGGGDTLHFFYDANGKRTSLNYNGATYAYLYNAQGDVVALSDTNGTVVVEYTYDAWGNPLSVTGTGATTIGQKNPFRYRGYFYDIETGLYYLQSRYYSPKIGRFICADEEENLVL